MHRTANVFRSRKNVAKKLVTQKLAATSGVPPPFRKNRVVFFRKCQRCAGGIAVRCVALRHRYVG